MQTTTQTKADRVRGRAYGHLVNANRSIDAVASTIDTVLDVLDLRTAFTHLDDAQAQINQARAELLKIL